MYPSHSINFLIFKTFLALKALAKALANVPTLVDCNRLRVDSGIQPINMPNANIIITGWAHLTYYTHLRFDLRGAVRRLIGAASTL